MKVRKSIWLAFVASLVLCIIPKIWSVNFDNTQTVGTENWTTSGNVAYVQTVSSNSEVMFTAAGASLHYLINQSTMPTVTANSTLHTGSSDMVGAIDITGGSTSSSTMTFVTGYSKIPFCVASDTTSVNVVQVNPSTFSVIFTLSGNRNDTINYLCIGR